MKCVRCNQDFDDFIPKTNAENYGDLVLYACPHCGKLHGFRRVTIVRAMDDDYIGVSEKDDYGNRIVTDAEYEKLQG